LNSTIKGFRDIVNGKYDHFPEQAFYMVGDIDTVKARADEIAKEVAASNYAKGITTDEAKVGKGKKGQVVAPKRDMTLVENMMPIPKPTTTSDSIRDQLKALAEKLEKKELDYVAKLTAEGRVERESSGQRDIDEPYEVVEKRLSQIRSRTDPNKDEEPLKIGWNFPTKTEIEAEWAEWRKRFDQQTDISAFLLEHFAESNAAQKIKDEQDRKEMEE